jgi:hypothetical protein
MPNESVLCDRVRQVLQKGDLPHRRPDRTWSGPGADLLCAVCEQPVTRDQFEMEIQFAYDGHDRRLDKFHLHVRCFAVWEVERTAEEPAPQPETRTDKDGPDVA